MTRFDADDMILTADDYAEAAQFHAELDEMMETEVWVAERNAMDDGNRDRMRGEPMGNYQPHQHEAGEPRRAYIRAYTRALRGIPA